MSVKLLTEHHLEFLSLKEGCTGSSESTLVKMPPCWKSHVTAHILFGLFYRPPNSNSLYFSSIEDSIHLTVDTGIQYIIVISDFNYSMLNSQTSSKIKSICEQFSFTQTINAPTHFTEHSSSLIDIILTMNKNNLLYTKIRDRFLN